MSSVVDIVILMHGLQGDKGAERALEEDVLRVTAEFHTGEGGKSPMIEVKIMSIAGDVVSVQVSPDGTVRNRCRQQQDMNCLCVAREQSWSSRRRWR